MTITFGLFTCIGGPITVLATLISGTLTYLAAAYGGLSRPFLLSLAIALLTYGAGAVLERLSPRRALG